MNILIIGGAGYIGGVTAHLATETGHTVTVADNLTTGRDYNIPTKATYIPVDIRNRQDVAKLFGAASYDAVMHFAAKIQVAESMQKPYEYYETNTTAALNTIDEAVKNGVKNYIFSSSAAVYGAPKQVPLQEDDPKLPVNPYGMSKLLTERLLRSYEVTHGLHWAALRYFNVAGAYAGVGTDYPFVSHIVPMLLEKMTKNEPIQINGTDYETPDGTAIRDYVHVADLGRAHLLAAQIMTAGEPINQAINLGSRNGYSVKEVADTFNKVTGADMSIIYGPRRAGDPPSLIASHKRAKKILGWEPQHDLEKIIKDHYDWFIAKDKK